MDEDPIMDIDGRDAKNQLAVVEYVEDIYAYYRRMEVSHSCKVMILIILIMVISKYYGSISL